MRFKFPDKKDVNKMYKILKTFNDDDIFGFFGNIKHRIFTIKCDLFKSVVVIDPKERRMDIFVGNEGMQTCHNMFAGKTAAVTEHGFNQFHILHVDKKELQTYNCARYFENYRFYSKDGKALCYLSSKPGQLPFVCDEIEIITLSIICEYLLHIKGFYESGEEKPVETEDELVVTFDFDDENMEYDSMYEKLECFNFEEEIPVKPFKDKNLIEKFSAMEINAGTIHVGIGYGNQPYDTFEYSNDVYQSLNPIYMFACNEEFLEYNIYSTNYKNSKKCMKEELVKLFSQIGLYDTVVTTNPYIYMMLEKNLKPLGIEVILDYEDFLCFVILMHISMTIDTGASFEDTQLLLDKLKETFSTFVEFLHDKEEDFVEMLQQMGNDSLEEYDDTIFEDQELDEDDEMFFVTDSKDVC